MPDTAQAVVEITDLPHTGCARFSQRFGVEAHRFVNSEVGKELKLHGVNARVVVPGTIRSGDVIRELCSAPRFVRRVRPAGGSDSDSDAASVADPCDVRIEHVASAKYCRLHETVA